MSNNDPRAQVIQLRGEKNKLLMENIVLKEFVTKLAKGDIKESGMEDNYWRIGCIALAREALDKLPDYHKLAMLK